MPKIQARFISYKRNMSTRYPVRNINVPSHVTNSDLLPLSNGHRGLEMLLMCIIYCAQTHFHLTYVLRLTKCLKQRTDFP